ncbi:histidine kinase [Clostridium sp. D33t1_170424_F3]|uniref:sensor histidine kinase n=1 Tax=Clostridium sp. D33t1_170424_F3 TaxID=2787099 RepID=UPI0018AAA7E2|nr:histidine kinase [Clostridium sp. D33t1_170424_F3]
MRSQITAIFLLCVVPVLLIALASSLHAIRVVRDQAFQSNRNTLALRMESIDRDLENTSSFLSSFLLDTSTYSKISAPRDSLARLNALTSVQSAFSKYLHAYQNTDGLFFYYHTTRDYIAASLKNETIVERNAIRKFLLKNLTDSAFADQWEAGWFPQEIDGQYYLLRITKLNGVYAGSWICADNLALPTKKVADNTGGLVLLSTADRQPMTDQTLLKEKNIILSDELQTGGQFFPRPDYLIADVSSATGSFHLLFLIPDRTLLEGLDLSNILLILLSVVSIAGIPILMVLLWRNIFVPLRSVTDGMHAVRNGNFDVNLPDLPRTTELAAVTDAFNEMTREIHTLKIDVYEEQLKRNRAQLQYLNLQIKPHFFLNSLNVIYSLALVKDYRLILEMTTCLMKHFRYMFKSPDTLVTIQEELVHVQNYLRIQELRFDAQFRPFVELEPALYDACIPTLVLHTFVENIVKHAYSNEKETQIHISMKEEGEALDIKISDNGSGYPEGLLPELNLPELPDEDRETHIGIYNIRQRLKLIYGQQAVLHFDNLSSGGAAVHLRLPLVRKEGGPGHEASFGG